MPRKNGEPFPVATCARCGDAFEKTNPRKKYCNPCAPLAEKERAKARAAEVAAHKKAYMIEWRAANADKVLEYSRAYGRSLYERHIGDEVECPDCGEMFILNAARRQRCVTCSEKRHRSTNVIRAAKWNSENSERRQARLTERYATDPAAKLHVLMANGIGDTLGGVKGRRKWQDLVPYSVEDLMRHIEAKFLPGMTWDNHAVDGWHIDHIRPKASFRITSAEDPQFLECWGLENLQPLWAADNLRKNKKWTPANDNNKSKTEVAA